MFIEFEECDTSGDEWKPATRIAVRASSIVSISETQPDGTLDIIEIRLDTGQTVRHVVGSLGMESPQDVAEKAMNPDVT